MSRHFLSKRDIKAFKDQISDLPLDFSEFQTLEIDESSKPVIYYYKKKPFFYLAERLLPTLYYVNTNRPEKNRVTVDDGAVPHVLKGAGIFIRGIVAADEGIDKGDMVFVRNLKDVYICVGISNTDTSTLLSRSDGEGIKNIHFLEDDIMKIQ